MIISAVEYFVDIEEVASSNLASSTIADVAQLVEQRIENPCVTGSNPVFGTKVYAPVAKLVKAALSKGVLFFSVRIRAGVPKEAI